MADDLRVQSSHEQIDELIREIWEAELFAQRLREYIVAIRDEVAAGHAGRALSMCNQALTEIDGATGVVAPSPHLKEPVPTPTMGRTGTRLGTHDLLASVIGRLQSKAHTIRILQ